MRSLPRTVELARLDVDNCEGKLRVTATGLRELQLFRLCHITLECPRLERLVTSECECITFGGETASLPSAADGGPSTVGYNPRAPCLREVACDSRSCLWDILCSLSQGLHPYETEDRRSQRCPQSLVDNLSPISAVCVCAIADAPALERLDTTGQKGCTSLDLPPLPNLRALCISRVANIERLVARRAPRLRWVALAQCSSLREVAVDCPELAWLGVDRPVHVTSACDCPLMERGETELGRGE